MVMNASGARAVMGPVSMHPLPPATTGGLHVPSQKHVLVDVATTRKLTVLGTPAAHFGNIIVL